MITWRDKMSIDDGGVIDQDHKHLIDIINRFEDLAADGLNRAEAMEILHALKFYTQSHFGREEQLQNLINFPDIDGHHHEHVELIAKLDTVVAHLFQTEEDHLHRVHAEIAGILHDWLINHILHSDLKMRAHVDAMMKHAPQFGALKDLSFNPG